MAFPIKLDQLVFPKSSPQAAKVLALLSSDDPDFDEVDKLILQDPMLAGTLLRYANSPLYRRGSEISSVPTATRLIGLKNVRSAVVQSILRASSSVDSALAQMILAHSLRVASICKSIAHCVCPAKADDLELIGLMHDVGMVVLAANMEDEYKAIVVQSKADLAPLDELELAHFGYSHDQISAKALHEFRLPQRHEAVLTHFHQPGNDELDAEMLRERAVLVLAHRLLAEVEETHGFLEVLFESTDALCEQLEIDQATLAGLREQAANLTAETDG